MASEWLQRNAERMLRGIKVAGLAPGHATPERHSAAAAWVPSDDFRVAAPTSPGPASPFPHASAGEWVCDCCTFVNTAQVATCDVCGHCAWALEKEAEAPKARGWTCDRCTFVNTQPGSTCEVCNANGRRSSNTHIGGWKCRRCTFENRPSDAQCDACGSTESAPKSSSPPPAVTPLPTPPRVSPPRPLAAPEGPGGSVADSSGWIRSSGLDLQLRQQEADAANHIANQCSLARAVGQLFVDEDFPASDRSLYGNRGHDGIAGKYEWKRPSSFGNGWTVIGQSISPDDILQGELGDCWFLSALSVLADRPHLIDRVLLTKKVTREGAYAVRFFHEGDWKRVIVDDFFPTKHRQLAFGHCKGQQLWVSIIEKAYAKLHGSYAAIVAGLSFNALFDLTGAPCESISLEKAELDLELLWAQLLSFKQSNFLLAAACCRQGASKEYLAQMGLVQYHAYALVDVRAESGYKLVKLRNPWGRTEWNGDWGRRSQRWTPEWRRRLEYYDNGGTFWMAYSDFVVYFGSVDVCKEQASWFSLSLPASIPDTSFSPNVMFELNAPTATWLFAMLIQQKPQRGEGRDADFADLALLVVEDGPGRGQQRLIAQIWPSLDRVCHADFLTVRDQPRYLLVPYSTSSRSRPVPFIFAVYSARPVSVRPVPCSTAPLRQHLPLAVTTASNPQQLHPGVSLYSLQRGSAVFVVVVNRDPADYVTVEVDSSGSTNLTSSRTKLVTRDTLPPQTRQLVTIMSQKIGTHSFKWKMKCSALKMTSALWYMQGCPAQSPPLWGPGDVHEPQPLRGGGGR